MKLRHGSLSIRDASAQSTVTEYQSVQFWELCFRCLNVWRRHIISILIYSHYPSKLPHHSLTQRPYHIRIPQFPIRHTICNVHTCHLQSRNHMRHPNHMQMKAQPFFRRSRCSVNLSSSRLWKFDECQDGRPLTLQLGGCLQAMGCRLWAAQGLNWLHSQAFPPCPGVESLS